VKITWITNHYPPDPGGMSRSCARLVNSLRDRGHSIHVVEISRPDRGNTEHAGHSADEGFGPAAAYHTVSTSGAYEQLFFSIRKELSGTLLVGFGGGAPSYLAVLWAKWLGLRSMALFRGNDFDRLVHDPRQAWMVHFVLEHADLVGAVSSEMVRRIATHRKKTTIFTHNGIAAEEWSVFPRDLEKAEELRATYRITNRPVIAMFGQLKYKKGLETAISIFDSGRLREQACLMTVGDIDHGMKAQLTETCGESWIPVPFRDRGDLPVYYLASDIVFIPSFFDGMPNVLLEAMAVGVVVVASDAGGIPDVISDGVDGFLFEAGNYLSAEECLRKVMRLPSSQRKEIAAMAKKKITEQFTPAHEVQVLEKRIAGIAGISGMALHGP